MSQGPSIVWRLKAVAAAPMAVQEQEIAKAKRVDRAVPGLALLLPGRALWLLATIIFIFVIAPSLYSFFLDWIETGNLPDDAAINLIWAALFVWQLIGLLRFLQSRWRRAHPPSLEAEAGPKGVAWGGQTVRASRLGVGLRRERKWSAFRWSAFEKLERKSDRLNLHVTDDWTLIIPYASFADNAEIDAFCRFAQAQMRK